MKIKKSELKQIIQEEIETSAIEEGLWDTIVGGTIQGGHDAAKNVDRFVTGRLNDMKRVLGADSDKGVPFQYWDAFGLRDAKGTWNSPPDIIHNELIRRGKIDNFNPQIQSPRPVNANYLSHLKNIKDLRYRYPTNKKLALAQAALEGLDQARLDLIKAARAVNAEERARAWEETRRETKRLEAIEADRKMEQDLATARTRRATEPEPTPKPYSQTTDLQRSRSRGTMYGGGGMGESINKADLHGIVLEELQAVLAEMKDEQ